MLGVGLSAIISIGPLLGSCLGTPPAAQVTLVAKARVAAPRLIAIMPASGPAGQAYPLRATISGKGFMATGNVVQFGPVKLDGLASVDRRKKIEFSVPKIRPSRGEVPPMVIPPGDYDVTVTTKAGTSNALKFTLSP